LRKKLIANGKKKFQFQRENYLLGCYYSKGGTQNEMGIMDLNPYLRKLYRMPKRKEENRISIQ